MPEGPEIRRAADKIQRAIAGEVASDVFFAFDRLKPYEDELVGHTVTAVKPYGKALVTRFDNGLAVYSHNQLYGIWVICKPDAVPASRRQLRFSVQTSRRWALLYSASDIEVLSADAVLTHPYIAKLGPDTLDATVTPTDVEARTLSAPFRRRQFATLLLDQGFLGGIGNYLRTEILYVACIHPAQRPVDCTPEQIAAFAEAALALPQQSYRHNGITNDLALAAHLKQTGYRRRDYRHWAFGRQGKPCYRCGTAIAKIVIGGRRCYICPQCQPVNHS
ncbi:endonuclease VIII [Nodosilinea sp. LEGE 06152]|uniref:endonuclease VIII n=1 Tax=Nodosilinea sp. LEGE 06152 TaxID=2777966 RepID=UPI00187F4AA6|nr:endonuclease VIII [Nodosilinea sp. LEGE 06152]MBE9156146.1 endonuclease VIII [Nodosilinea sp. LEGE 06152]